jgi:hypothetical protein
MGWEDEYDPTDDEDLGFVIVKSSDVSGTAYLVDRDRFPNKWWSRLLSEAKSFQSEIGASKVCDKLKYGNPRVSTRRSQHIN